MSITGAPDEAGGGPTKVGVAISDVVTGMLGAVGVLAALARPRAGRRPAAGRGQRIDVSLLGVDPGQSSSTRRRTRSSTGVAPARLGNAHPNIVPYETFATADGAIAVAVGSERQWPRLCEALGLPGAGDRSALRDERRPGRAAGRAPAAPGRALRRAADGATGSAALDAAEVPCGPINDVARRVRVARGGRARDDRRAWSIPAWGVIRQVGVPFQLSATPASIRTPPPLLGEDTDAILAELGYAAAEIARLRADGVV